jgi:hypothetical protein
MAHGAGKRGAEITSHGGPHDFKTGELGGGGGIYTPRCATVHYFYYLKAGRGKERKKRWVEIDVKTMGAHPKISV